MLDEKPEQQLILQQKFKKIFNQVFPNEPFNYKKLKGGISNHMFETTIKEIDYIIRIYPDHKNKPSYYEPDLIGQLLKLQAPVPKVIAHQTEGCGGSFMVYEKIRGPTLGDAVLTHREIDNLSYDLIEYFNKLKTITVLGFGSLVTLNKAEKDTVNDFIDQAFEKCIKTVSQTQVLSSTHLSVMERVKDKFSSHTFDNSLGWGDLSLFNIVLDEKNRLRGIIDFESYFKIDSALSLGYFHAIAPNNKLLPLLIKNSTNSLNFTQENMHFFTLLRLARLAVHAHKPMPNGQDQKPVLTFLTGAIQSLDFFKNYKPKFKL